MFSDEFYSTCVIINPEFFCTRGMKILYEKILLYIFEQKCITNVGLQNK